MLKRLPGLILLVVVALLTQVGGLALALGWLVGRWLLPAQGASAAQTAARCR